MKQVTRCGECKNRLIDMGIGFVPNVTMSCSVFEYEVDKDDGCTFGEKGEGGYVTKSYDVSIDGYAAVNGCDCGYEWEKKSCRK